LGIRSATALEDAFRRDSAAWAIPDQGHAQLLNQEENHDLVEGLRWVLNTQRANGTPDNPSVTQTILKALRDEPNLMHVRNWKYAWNLRRGNHGPQVCPTRHRHRTGAFDTQGPGQEATDRDAVGGSRRSVR
jgi:hypothetical protein